MKIASIVFASLLVSPALFAAEKQSMEGMPMDHKGMDMPMDQKATTKTGKATGVVKKVDTEKGSVTIAHGPVEALGWPSMTMGFKAEATQLQGLKQGDKVKFEFASTGMDSTITRIEKQ
ncbi:MULTISPECIES: copper-binding protein [Pseudomonas]|jgi:Cu(I)/Ag(I) efflux system protein CusF|uniref:Copper-binding protein n=2 Tax=Pseudomonas TaxID=286 RepID=A0ABS0FTX5_PSELU|nr:MULTISPECIES: copper-binding protein [Pseudomonas]ENA26948.1 hypothetical protein HMPREF1487_09427 [Pseudomonas sp. HPB0071]MBA1250441.1 copper-binding protein [Pseudomonas zeshuii]MBF8643838.1 copper-binding protein [Pseudomonas zeshuii]MBW5415216.1 hypothetical protein [Pseudomonas sp. MAG002Y]MCG7373947.1 copper-binding protein [Pseudomonas luteola]